MARRRHDGEAECTCEPPRGAYGWERHHYGCALWGPQVDSCITGVTKPTKAFLGSRKMAYEKWAKTVSMYYWPLWRNWKGPKAPIKIETPEEVTARLLRYKPQAANSWEQHSQEGCDYTWTLWHQHKTKTKGPKLPPPPCMICGEPGCRASCLKEKAGIMGKPLRAAAPLNECQHTNTFGRDCRREPTKGALCDEHEEGVF